MNESSAGCGGARWLLRSRARSTRDGQLGRWALGDGHVPFAAERVRLEVDVDLVAELLPGAQPEPSELEILHKSEGSHVPLFDERKTA